MTTSIWLNVYRRLDNRFTFDDNSGFAWSLHELRSKGLHEALDSEEAWIVADWGLTDDDQSTHELVNLLLHFKEAVEGVGGLTPVMAFVGGVLAKALSETAAQALVPIIQKLTKQQKDGKINDFFLSKELESPPLVSIYPPSEQPAHIIIWSGATAIQINLDAKEDELPQQLPPSP
jgi:hypothetical protein